MQSEKPRKPRKKKKERDENKPKRPVTAFMLWLNSNRENIKSQNPSISVTEIAKKGGEMWKELEDKSEWEEKASVLKKKYAEAMKEYEESGGAKEAKERAAEKNKSEKAEKKKKEVKKDEASPSKLMSGSSFKSKEYISDESSSENESDSKPKQKESKAKNKQASKKGKESEEEEDEDEDENEQEESEEEKKKPAKKGDKRPPPPSEVCANRRDTLFLISLVSHPKNTLNQHLFSRFIIFRTTAKIKRQKCRKNQLHPRAKKKKRSKILRRRVKVVAIDEVFILILNLYDSFYVPIVSIVPRQFFFHQFSYDIFNSTALIISQQ